MLKMESNIYILIGAALFMTASSLPNPDEKVRVVELDFNQAPCACPDLYRPVCGSDGHSYANECEMKCAGKDTIVAHEALCPGDQNTVKVPSVVSTCTCVRNLKPVCGADGVTYNNECLLRCAHQTAAHEGACDGSEIVAQQPCICTRQFKPVCGTDGRTYANNCVLRCVGNGVGVAREGQCVGNEVLRADVKF